MSSKVVALYKLLGFLLWLFFLGLLLVRSSSFGWDFHVYQLAARDFLQHKDPFEDSYQVQIGSIKPFLPFIYPPIAIWPITVFAGLSDQVGFYVWTFLEVSALTYLAVIWKRSFGIAVSHGAFGIYCLLAFNATVFTGLATGNIAIFECLAMYLAFEALLKQRDVAFTAWILLIAAFKLVPIVYLLLLLVFGGPSRVRVVVYGFFAFFLYLAANVGLYPQLAKEFFAAALSRHDTRANNPSLLAFCSDLGDRVPHLPGSLLYLIIASWIGWITFRTLKSWANPPPALKLLFIVQAIALCMPRYMIYSYIQLLPITWLVLSSLVGSQRRWTALLIGFILPGSYLIFLRPSLSMTLEHALGIQPSVYGYLSLYGNFVIWTLLRSHTEATESYFRSNSEMGLAVTA